jgi:glutamine amidotransferase
MKAGRGRTPRILVVDYGMGNLRSVAKALESLGSRMTVSAAPSAFGRADGVVLPGVGAFAEAMTRMRRLGLRRPLAEWIAADRPFLGICLGYQLLFQESAEFGRHLGLAFFPGRVVPFPRRLKVPHMGWNTLRAVKKGWLLARLGRNPYVYFVHSFLVKPSRNSDIAATTDYGVRFASAVERGAVAGVQFHPEKSQRTGLRILKNYLGAVRRRMAD